MPNTLTIDRPASHTDLWTPWGPQTTSPRDGKMASLRRTLKKLVKHPKGRGKKHEEVVLAPADPI